MRIIRLHLGHLRTNCYLVEGVFEGERYMMVVDPADSAEKIMDAARLLDAWYGAEEPGITPLGAEVPGTELGTEHSDTTHDVEQSSVASGTWQSDTAACDITHIVLTHAHFDHIGAVRDLKRIFPKSLFCAGIDEDTSERQIKRTMLAALGDYYYKKLNVDRRDMSLPEPDALLSDGDKILDFKVISTPGHTNGSICLYCGSEGAKSEGALFAGSPAEVRNAKRLLGGLLLSGDTLFKDGHGRTDLFGNEYDMAASIHRLMRLSGDTTVLPGHGPLTTIGAEARLWTKADDT